MTSERSTGRVGHPVLMGLLAVAAATSIAFIQSAAAGASVTATSHFTVTGDSSNTSGDSTFINDAATNGLPDDILFVSQNWNAQGVCGCVYNTAPVGVWYDSGNDQWAVFNESGSAMPAGASFNVLAVPASSSSVFVQTATSANIAGDSTFIDSSLTNDNPGAQLQVTQDWNPGGSGGVYNNHNIGVWYDTTNHEWAIFNQDEATMTTGAAFNVMVGTAPSNGGTGAVQKVKAKNTAGDSTLINNAVVNGDPNAVVFTTPNWDPSGSGGTYDDVAPGVWWTGSTIAVFQEDTSSMIKHSAFNVLMFSS
jgi:hypothetical protein